MTWWRKLFWPFKRKGVGDRGWGIGKDSPNTQHPTPNTQSSPQRVYSGAIYNRLTSDWVASGTSADSEVSTSLRPLRNRSRSLCRDNDYAKGAVRTICNNIVGKGIALQAKVKQRRGDKYDEKLNKQIEELWTDWGKARYCDVAGKLDFCDIERLAMRSIVESGEVLVRLVRKKFDGSPVPLALELIEADQLADEQWNGTSESGNEIRMGVEIDKWGRPVAYHLYERHPGDYQFTSRANTRLIRVPASEMVHLFVCERPGQTRGVPWFHTALLTFRHVGGYTEAELVAARAHASVMGFIQTPDGDTFAPQVMDGQRITSLEPGAIEVLNPGETFNGFDPTRPNQGFDPFVRAMLRGVAAGIGMSYEALSRDFTNTSYSSARTSLMDERDNYRVIQAWFSRRLHERIYEQWLDLAVMSGALNLSGYELNRSVYQKAKFTARGWQWVDPQNEVAANKEAVKAGFTSLSEVVAQQGLDIEDVLADQKRVLDLAKELGVVVDVAIGSGEEEAPSVQDGFTPVSRSMDILRKCPDLLPHEDFVPGDYIVTNLLEFRSLQEMGAAIFFDVMPGMTRTFSPRQRAKNCKTGIACGNSCISKNKICKQTLTPQIQAQKPPAAKKTKKASSGTATPPATGTKGGLSVTTVEDSAESKAMFKNLAAISKKKADAKDQYRPLYRDSQEVWDRFEYQVSKPANKDQVMQVLKDEQGKVQSGVIYAVRDQHVKIDLLATHPDNIDPLNPARSRGSGTMALIEVAKIAQKEGKPIFLYSLKRAESYYEKMGFVKKGKANGYMGYELSGDALRSLASLGGN